MHSIVVSVYTTGRMHRISLRMHTAGRRSYQKDHDPKIKRELNYGNYELERSGIKIAILNVQKYGKQLLLFDAEYLISLPFVQSIEVIKIHRYHKP